MDCDDTVLMLVVILVISVFLIYRAGMMKSVKKNLTENEHSSRADTMTMPPALSRAREHMARPVLAERMRDPSVGLANGATHQRALNRATIGDANARHAPSDLFPENIKQLPSDWKEMFEPGENTLAQENFIEPSYEYAIGAINVPKRFLSQDLRGMPEVTTYENLSLWNNSPFGGLDLTESETRRAGDL